EGIHVGTGKMMLMNQIVSIMQVPPDIRICDFAVRKNKYQGEKDECEYYQKRHAGLESSPPVPTSCYGSPLVGLTGLGQRCFLYSVNRLNRSDFDAITCVHRHHPPGF